MALNFNNLNSLWASVMVETLAQLGLKSAIICPGSRSTPLTVALARHPDIEAIPVLDERSAGFWALGLAKASGIPTVLVCTSGTAGANFYPAVIEARYSHVPLIVLTGDRPPELRQCSSGQTINQINLFGEFAQFFSEMATPVARLEMLQYARQTMVQAWRKSLFPQCGVAHLNCPFRDPLPPNILDNSVDFLRNQIDPVLFFQNITSPTPSQLLSLHLPVEQWEGKKGIIIAGVDQPDNPKNYTAAIATLSQTLGYPVLAEALSPLRNFADFELITTYDFILRNSDSAEALLPEVVIQIGALPTSKTLRAWLQKDQIPTWVISPNSDNLDPLHRPTHTLSTSIEQISQVLSNNQKSHSDYAQKWQFYQQQTLVAIAKSFRTEPNFIEAKVAWLLSQYLPEKSSIFFANSMTVRYAEFFWQQNKRQIQPYFNRGANGIDGTLSTAIALAHSNNDRPCVLLTGDLALLHDTNGFLTVSQCSGSLTIIVVNNNGGGIFEMLPIATVDDVFEEYFVTPQLPSLEKLAATYAINYQKITDESALVSVLSNLPKQGMQLIEILGDRQRDTQWLKALFQIFQ
ncbi:2-succinyl-5-enolpyruvyl-6-hydroxy-3-cyclohexene-1-carboxylic-acid synthase [[Limnothrix rosea] IAM M-220]|uniref:2-succinyl-5-enolpyruvyl-6-hydroxy-3- cyclohexene-1-carboxylic-acid synthase n=1 Tax=[Limnothrix rosea] IAM M-220 TaxID=454133 RepID=UPI0009624EBE|nr:2-succinyl-5-enolpyruvyl-6-hydroxy-3-cyclohexene-1-carboxylic-acid synthase [[Limnothrix rosea] IAM M-220]OKH17786.1 2-succinyl-5-enolpyruvyl-6-hydroxy-3-cyclohexene-1-carboxylic-acid synthase [[Limnothrix rosea] IAM M-220]